MKPRTSPTPVTRATVVSRISTSIVRESGRRVVRPRASTGSTLTAAVSPARTTTGSGEKRNPTGSPRETVTTAEPATPLGAVAWTTLVPSSTAVTVPRPFTVATSVRDDVQRNTTSTSFPAASRAAAWSCSSAPMGRSTESGSTTTDVTSPGATTTRAESIPKPVEPTSQAVPARRPVTTPEASTAATCTSREVHVAPAHTVEEPSARTTDATRRAVSPLRIRTLSGVTTSAESPATCTAGTTTNVADAVSAPRRAVTVTVPGSTPVASPAEATVAAEASELLQLTSLISPSSFPATSRPVARNCVASPTRTVSAAGSTARAARAPVVTRMVAVPSASPECAVTVASPTAPAVTTPAASTAATAA